MRAMHVLNDLKNKNKRQKISICPNINGFFVVVLFMELYDMTNRQESPSPYNEIKFNNKFSDLNLFITHFIIILM
jgi:hypothetical protein